MQQSAPRPAMRSVILFAPNVGSGGGFVLLKAMLEAWPRSVPLIALLNDRGRKDIENINLEYERTFFPSAPVGRLRAEWKLWKLSKSEDTVFCFHNLPPLFPVRGYVVCYVHNPNLVGLVPKNNLSGWVAKRCAIERFIFSLFASRIDKYVVQTPSMALALCKTLGNVPQPVEVLPFVDQQLLPAPVVRSEGQGSHDIVYDFLYPSDGAPHKNHANLLATWELLADEGLFPTLAVTLRPDRDRDVKRQVEALVATRGVKIVDLGFIPHAKLLALYGRSRAMLFASYAESFGIPLIEAEAAGLPILAAELDFVHDVCTPTLTFDPQSPRSIARTVRRFLRQPEASRPLLDPQTFLRTLFQQPPNLDSGRAIADSGQDKNNSD